MHSDLRQLIRALERQGYTVEQTRNNHYTVRLDGVRVATLAGSPSDRRSWNNQLAHLKATGFTWPPKR